MDLLGIGGSGRSGNDSIYLWWACPQDTQIESPTITSMMSASMVDTFDDQQLIDGRILYYSKDIGFSTDYDGEYFDFSEEPDGTDYKDYIISQLFGFSLSNGHTLFIYLSSAPLTTGEQQATVYISPNLELTEAEITTLIQNKKNSYVSEGYTALQPKYLISVGESFNTTLTATDLGSDTLSISVDMDEYITGATLNFTVVYTHQTVTYRFPNYELWFEPSNNGSNLYLDDEFVKQTNYTDEYHTLCTLDLENNSPNPVFLEAGTN